MIKTVINMPPGPSYDGPNQLFDNIRQWMVKSFGPDVVRRPDNTRKRKAWSITSDYYNRTITIMCRTPEQALLTKLRWS